MWVAKELLEVIEQVLRIFVSSPGDVPDERSDRRKLLKIAGGCTILCPLDGASLRSLREDAGGI